MRTALKILITLGVALLTAIFILVWHFFFRVPLTCDVQRMIDRYNRTWAYKIKEVIEVNRVDKTHCDMSYYYGGPGDGADRRRFTFDAAGDVIGMGGTGSGSTVANPNR